MTTSWRTTYGDAVQHLTVYSRTQKFCIKPVRAVAAETPLTEQPVPDGQSTMTKSSLLSDDPAATLAAIRKEMKASKVNAYIVPSEDPHMSEYPPDCCNRRVFLSGFTGSAGAAVVLEDKALLWTDGRRVSMLQPYSASLHSGVATSSPGVGWLPSIVATESGELGDTA